MTTKGNNTGPLKPETSALSLEARQAQVSVLVNAAAQGDYARIRSLPFDYSWVNDSGSNGQTPLVAAALRGMGVTPWIVRWLLDHGADANGVACGVSPLEAAARSENRRVGLACMRRLLSAGADPLMARPKGNTLIMAMGHMHHAFGPTEKMLDLLLSCGVPLNATDASGWSALDIAVASPGQADLIKCLLRRGAIITDHTLSVAMSSPAIATIVQARSARHEEAIACAIRVPSGQKPRL